MIKARTTLQSCAQQQWLLSKKKKTISNLNLQSSGNLEGAAGFVSVKWQRSLSFHLLFVGSSQAFIDLKPLFPISLVFLYYPFRSSQVVCPSSCSLCSFPIKSPHCILIMPPLAIYFSMRQMSTLPKRNMQAVMQNSAATTNACGRLKSRVSFELLSPSYDKSSFNYSNS